MKVTVELVKYDMDKTKKRKRSNLIVESKTEQAVMAKLEKIHKGEKVQAIHEIVWGAEELEGNEVLKGIVKFFDVEKGFGFIQPDIDMDDLFFHITSIGALELTDNAPVEFEVSEGPKGLVATKIKLLEE